MKAGVGDASDLGSKVDANDGTWQLRPSLAMAMGSLMIFVGLVVPSDNPIQRTVFVSIGLLAFMNLALGRWKSGYRPPPLTGWARGLNFGLVAVLVLLVLAFVSGSPDAAFGEYSTRTILQLAMLANFWVILLIQILGRKPNKSAQPISLEGSEDSTWDRELDG